MRPADDFLHTAKEFMGIVYTGDPPEPGYGIAGKDGIQVDGAEGVHFAEKQEKKEPEIVFGIKSHSSPEPGFQPALAERLLRQGRGIVCPAADQGHVITSPGQRTADPDHPLVEDQVVRHRKKKSLFHAGRIGPRKGAKISQIRQYNRDISSIFGLNF